MNNDEGALTPIGNISDFDDVVNDPTRGYEIFIENMLSEAEKIK